MNQTMENIFQQLSDLRNANNQLEAKINLLDKQGGGKATVLKFPTQQIPGVIEYPGYMPIPWTQEIEMKSKSKTAFGTAVEKSVGQIKIDIDQPIYMIGIFASLIKTKGTILDIEGEPIPDPGIGLLLPMSNRHACNCPEVYEYVGGELSKVPIYRYRCDFQFKMFFEKKKLNLTNNWMPSQVFDSDNEQGYIFPCQYPLKRGESFTVEAQPYAKVRQEGDGFEVKFYPIFIEMIVDPSKVMDARARADQIQEVE